VDDLWATNSKDVGLIVRAISFKDFQPMWSWSTNVTDSRTVRRTDDMRSEDRALHYSASHGNNEWIFVTRLLYNNVCLCTFELYFMFLSNLLFLTSLWHSENVLVVWYRNLHVIATFIMILNYRYWSSESQQRHLKTTNLKKKQQYAVCLSFHRQFSTNFVLNIIDRLRHGILR